MHILELFNKTVDKNQMPQEWDTGMVIIIHKKGTESKCENYRSYFTAHSIEMICKHNKKQIK
jgi:hypothetical protein